VSIFNKICPRCAGENAVSDSRCQCGFVFDSAATTGSFQATEIALQEAEVYAEYLQVRMLQAKESAEVAIADQARSPEDGTKSSVAAEANAEFQAAKSEYDEQMKVVVQLRGESRATQDAETHRAQQAAWAKAAERAKTEKAKKAAEAEKAKKAAEAEKAKKAAEAEKAKKAAEAEKAKKAAEAEKAKKAAEAEKAKKAAIAKKSASTKSAKPVAAKTIPAQTSSANVGQSTPTPAMKQKMASAADVAASRTHQQKSAVIVAAKPVRTNKPVAPVKPVIPTEKECPNCTASVALSVKECKCGYSFAQGAEKMDGIGLSEEDRALLGLS
jgi:hypothetical protein